MPRFLVSKFLDSIIELLIKGVPESFLFILAIYILTRIKFDLKKYLFMSLIITFISYITKWLPINMGTHTMLSLLILILIFIIVNKVNLQNIIKSIISVIVVAIIIVISEVLNELLLVAIFGQAETKKLFDFGSAVIISVCMLPSTIIFAFILLILYFILLKYDKNKKVKDGKASEKIGE